MTIFSKYISIGVLIASWGTCVGAAGFFIGQEQGRQEVVRSLEKRVAADFKNAGWTNKANPVIEVDPYLLGTVRGVQDALNDLKVKYQIGNWRHYAPQNKQ